MDQPPAVEIAVPARAVQLSGFVLGLATGSAGRETPLLPGPARDDLSGEAALVVEAQAPRAVVRLRAAAGEPGRQSGHFDLLVANYRLPLGEAASLRIGKALLGWDTGLSFQPIGFFQKEPDFSDLGDFEGRAEGVPLVALNFALGRFDATLVASDRLDGGSAANSERRPRRQAAIRLAGEFAAVSASAILRYPDGGPLGLGGTISATAGQRWTLRASGYGDGDSLRGLVGATWAAPWQGSVNIELSHDSSGLDRRQRDALLSGAAGGTGRGQAGGSFRENYLFVQAGYDGDRLSASLGTRVGLDDGGALITAAATWRLARSAEVRLLGLVFTGPQGSEYRLSPSRALASIAVRRAF